MKQSNFIGEPTRNRFLTVDPVVLLSNEYEAAYWAGSTLNHSGIVGKNRFTGKWDAFTRDGDLIAGGFRSKSAASEYLTTY